MEEENTQTTEAVTATEAPQEAPSSPEYISEKFWDTDRNEIKVEELGASYNALEYKIVIPEVPEHINIEVNKDQELLKEWSAICKENNLSQEMFNRGVNAFVNNEIAGLPDTQQEMQKLGDNANSRVEAADLWSKKYLTPESYEVAAKMASTAEGVKALEEIMNLTKTQPLPNSNTVVDAELDETDLRSMMNDPRYYDPAKRDEAYYNKVTKLYEKKYG